MAAPDPKYVLDLAKSLEDAKSRLKKLQDEWDALFATAPAKVATPRKGGRGPVPNSNAGKVLKTISSDPAESWNADRIVQITRLSRKKVDRAIFNLSSARPPKIHRVDRGLYRIGPPPTADTQGATVN